MRGLSGTRWRLWLAFLATLVLTSCVEASADTTPPSVPTAVTAWAVGCKQINLAWNASTDTGGSGLGAYNVYVWQSSRSTFLKQLLATTTSGGCYPGRYTTSNTGLTASTTYYYSVAAVDKAGNASAPSVWVSAALPACVTATTVTTSTSTTLVSGDRTAPAMPTGLKAAAATCSQINLTWLASTDTGGSGLKGYNVYRNGVYMKQVLAPATSSSDGGLAASTVYSYAVKAVDNAGNASAMSTTASTNTLGCPVSGGQYLWAKPFGGTGNDCGRAVATDSSGNVFVIGSFSNTINNFGGTCGSLTSLGGLDVVLAKYSPAGTCVWAKKLGGTGNDFGYSLAVDASNAVVITGSFQNNSNGSGVDFGGGPSNLLVSAGTDDIFVAKYANDGGYVWAHRYGGSGHDSGAGVAIDRTFNCDGSSGTNCVVLTGSINTNGGPVSLGGAGLTNYYGTGDTVYVAKYSSAGAHLWSKTFWAPSSDYGRAIAVDPSGNIALTGVFGGSVDLSAAASGPPGVHKLTSNGQLDVFVAELAGDGSYHWSHEFGGVSNNDNGNGIATDTAGAVLVTGSVDVGSVDFGDGSVTTHTITGYVVKYAANGAFAWKRVFAEDGTTTSIAQAVATDSGNNVVVTGEFSTAGSTGVDFGTGPKLASGGGYEVFVAKYTSSDTASWSEGLGTSDFAYGITCDASDNSVLTGLFGVTTSFGSWSLTLVGSTDIFVARLGP